jgi:hypothetical protein
VAGILAAAMSDRLFPQLASSCHDFCTLDRPVGPGHLLQVGRVVTLVGARC